MREKLCPTTSRKISRNKKKILCFQVENIRIRAEEKMSFWQNIFEDDDEQFQAQEKDEVSFTLCG
jgi:hypothetical protein